MGSELFKVGQLAVTVSDVKKALEFYHNVLGLEFLFSPSESLALLQCGETRIMLSTPQGTGEIGKNSIPYFSCENIEQVHEQTVSKGAVMEQAPHLVAKMPDHELWIGFLKDPDGNLIGLMEEKK